MFLQDKDDRSKTSVTNNALKKKKSTFQVWLLLEKKKKAKTNYSAATDFYFTLFTVGIILVVMFKRRNLCFY